MLRFAGWPLFNASDYPDGPLVVAGFGCAASSSGTLTAGGCNGVAVVVAVVVSLGFFDYIQACLCHRCLISFLDCWWLDGWRVVVLVRRCQSGLDLDDPWRVELPLAGCFVALDRCFGCWVGVVVLSHRMLVG